MYIYPTNVCILLCWKCFNSVLYTVYLFVTIISPSGSFACGCVPFAMDLVTPLQPNRRQRLRQAIDHLFEVRPTDRCHFAWRLFAVHLIVFGCIIIATVTWYYPVSVWPRQQKLFYENPNNLPRGTSTEIDSAKWTSSEPKIACP